MSHIRHSFAQTKIFKNRAYIALIGFASLFLLIFFLVICLPFLIARWNSVSSNSSEVITFSVMVFLGMVIGLKISDYVDEQMDRKLDEFDKNWRNAERGDQGEKLVYESLTKWLPLDKYAIYSNLTLPDLRADLDFVIVGEKGVILVEVKNFTKNSNFYGKYNYFKRDLASTVNFRANILSNFLKQNGINDVYVRKVIVYVNPKSAPMRSVEDDKNHIFIAKGIEGFSSYIQNLGKIDKFSNNYCSEINKVLSQLDVSR